MFNATQISLQKDWMLLFKLLNCVQLFMIHGLQQHVASLSIHYLSPGV